MPTYGPWITPTTTRYGQTVPNTLPNFYYTGSQDATWTAARNGTGGIINQSLVTPGASTPVSLAFTSATFRTYIVGQVGQWFPVYSTDALLAPYTDTPMPPNAIDVQYETPHGTVLASPRTKVVIEAGHTSSGSVAAGTLDVYQFDPTTMPAVASPGYVFLTPIALAISGVNLIATITPAETATAVDGLPVVSTGTIAYVIVPTDITVSTWPYATTDGALGWPIIVPSIEYLGPRYRWVYATTPPLRQHPRDDFLGGAPRQGHVNEPKSVQGSTRQGWTNTYR